MQELMRKSVLDAGYVAIYEFSDSIRSLNHAMEFVGTIASISHGNFYTGERAIELANKLLYKWHHMSPFEFVRIPLSLTLDEPVSLGIEKSFRNNLSKYFCMWSKTKPEDFDSHVEVHRANLVLFKVKCPIFVARQIMRHRSFSFMERSMRYMSANDLQKLEFYLPAKDKLKNLPYNIRDVARFLIELGMDVETVRCILPLGTYTEFYILGDVFAYANFFKQRLGSGVQRETKQYAEAMLFLIDKNNQRFYNFLKKEAGEVL